jgi:hypothetical protein
VAQSEAPSELPPQKTDENDKNLSQDSQSPGQDMKSGPTKHEGHPI